MAKEATVREALTALADHEHAFFNVRELTALLGLKPEQGQHLAFRLARGNYARRLNRGVYALLPIDQWDDGEPAINWYLAAAALAEPGDYFLAYYTAMDLNRMTQHPLRTVFVAVTRQRRARTIGSFRIRFVTLRPANFFGYERRQVEEGRWVQVADLERTLIDGVDRPDLCGGLQEVFNGMVRRTEELDGDRLLRYLTELKKPVIAKRLGFLLEATGATDPRILWNIERIAGRARHYFRLDKMGPQEGPLNKRWELTLNTDVDRLIEQTRR